MISWADLQDIKINFIQPGNPQQNAYIERYNRTVRYDWLGQYLFSSLDELQNYATRWQWFSNHEKPEYGVKWLYTNATSTTNDLILLITSVKNGGIPPAPLNKQR